MQRTDQAERFLEKLASVPLTWENVFRSPQYTVKSDKEVVDLLLVLRNRGIFVSMKCQQNPQKRTGKKLIRWVQKSVAAALRQVGGGIKTSKTRDFWCKHQRRGKVSFKPNQIEPVRAVVIVETLEVVALSQDTPLEIDSVPVSYLSVNDFLNIIIELRTINDLIWYLDARCSICPELQRTVGIDKAVFMFYLLYRGMPPKVDGIQDILQEVHVRVDEVKKLLIRKKKKDLKATPIERVSNDLSKRPEDYKEGLDEQIIDQFDSASKRRNYLLIQDELCNLVLDERRQLGGLLSHVTQKTREHHSTNLIFPLVARLDSKPDFLYVLSSSKGLSRNEVFKWCSDLLQGGLAYYEKTRGLAINYVQGRDSYEVVLIHSFKATPKSKLDGNKYFAKQKVLTTPIEKV